MTFSCRQVGLRGLPLRALLVPIVRSSAWPPAAQLSFRAISPRWVFPSSHGIRPLPPLRRSSLRVSTPRNPEVPFGRAVPPARSRSAFTVSHRLDGFLHPGAAGLLHPASDHEVRRVSVACRQHHPEAVLCESASSPRRSHPSKNSPRQQPYRVTAAVALLPFPLASHAALRWLSPPHPPHSRGGLCASLPR
jgi:hypothetical protein